jgi:hypothetical protein
MVLPHNIHELVADLNATATTFNNLGGFSALLASGVLSPVGIGIKKLKDIKDGEVMLWIMAAASLVAGFLVYLFSTPQHDPTVIGFLGLVTFIGTQPFYKIIFKPLFTWVGGQFAQAKLQVEADRNPAAVPPEGLPVIGQ